MKSICLVSFLLFFLTSFAQKEKENIKDEKPVAVTMAEYMIGLPDIDDASLETVKAKFSESGVTVIGYCVQHKILYLTAPLNKENEQNFVALVQTVQPGATVNFKEGTFQSSLNDCVEMYKIINPQ